MINDSTESARYEANYKLIKTLVSALKTHNSFNYSFDSVKSITITASPDRRFRIFSWHVLNDDGTYRYYGSIQLNTGGAALKLFPLSDRSELIKAPQDSLLTNNHWYGCQYYKIIPVTYNTPRPYYILLGWKGYNTSVTQKIIEVLNFEGENVSFGRKIFDGLTDINTKYRAVFQYSRQVSMLLNYDGLKNTIIFDHLAPPDSAFAKNYAYYGPDLSYDGFKIERGRLKFVQDLDLKNEATKSDLYYIDPKLAPKVPVNKLQQQ